MTDKKLNFYLAYFSNESKELVKESAELIQKQGFYEVESSGNSKVLKGIKNITEMELVNLIEWYSYYNIFDYKFTENPDHEALDNSELVVINKLSDELESTRRYISDYPSRAKFFKEDIKTMEELEREFKK